MKYFSRFTDHEISFSIQTDLMSWIYQYDYGLGKPDSKMALITVREEM